MAKKIINIRLEDSVWELAKQSASLSSVTLQDWITNAITEKASVICDLSEAYVKLRREVLSRVKEEAEIGR